MRKLIFFLGPAGAGKTTIAKALAKKRHMALFDMDTLSRPAAEVIMTLSRLNPNDRDSAVYKIHCRDLGYRMTMDAALENLELGLDVIVVGPFTKEMEDAFWLENELLRIGASHKNVDVKALYLFLPDESLYRFRIEKRGLDIDVWKLENWNSFNQTLNRREIKWNLPASSILYFDNSEPLTHDKLTLIERFTDVSY